MALPLHRREIKKLPITDDEVCPLRKFGIHISVKPV
jgi:hypothetical protein